MAIRGRIKIDEAELLPSFAALKIGPWALVSLVEDEFRSSVAIDVPPADPFGFHLPGFWVLDARNHWKFGEDKKSVVVFKSALILRPNDELTKVGGRRKVCLALIGSERIRPRTSVTRQKFGTATARLEIGQIPRTFKLVGEVFVQPTSRGYAPAILVELDDGSKLHVLLGAKSFAEPLESYREVFGTLDGLRIRAKKDSQVAYGKYEIELLEEAHGSPS